jgi:hypothetical protein
MLIIFTFRVLITINYCSADDDMLKQTQYTFATLLHCADNSFAVKVVQQKVQYLGKLYSVYEIYGMDHTGEREGEGSRECIVCLSEPRDTAVLPCRHMCLCNGCAELMRVQTNKCPICRAPVRNLLRVMIAKDAPSQQDIQVPQESLEEDHEDELTSRRHREKELLSKQEALDEVIVS